MKQTPLTIEDIRNLGPLLAGYHPLGQPHIDFHKSQAETRWIFGGNQSSKTYTNMTDLAMILMNIHPYRRLEKAQIWVAIESWEQVRDILWADYLSEMLPAKHIYDIKYGQDRVPRKLYMKNGHQVEFKAFNQGRALFQGRKIDGCYCDEQCHRDFAGIFSEIQARLLVKNGFLSWSMTPILPQPDLEERLLALPEKDEVFYANLNLNRKSRGGYIADSRIDGMIADWPEEVQATRIEGKFASFFGSVYKTFNRSIHSVKPFDIPKDWRRWRSIDFGFTNPFVCLWLAKDPDENWYVYHEYFKAKTGIGEHIKEIKRRSEGEQYVETFADPENAEGRDQFRKAGLPTAMAQKAVALGIELVQSKLKVKADGKPSLRIFDKCKNTLREFPGYQYSTGTKTQDAKDIPRQKDDHTLDAVRYGIYTVDRPRKKGSAWAA